MRFTKVILDILTVKFLLSYSTRPLQIFGLLGLGSFVAGLPHLHLAERTSGCSSELSLANRPLLLLAVLLIVIGFQFIMLGLLAEIMVRAYHESSGKTIYVRPRGRRCRSRRRGRPTTSR